MISHHDAGYQDLADLTWHQNKTEYAVMHGYGMYARTEDFATRGSNDLMTGFEKIYIARDVLLENPEFDWIWWTGTDSMITNFSIKIEDRIDNNYHFIICSDINGINADSILLRNSPKCLNFLDKILELQDEVKNFWDTEQRAIGKLLDLPGTGDPGWPEGQDLVIKNQYKDVVKIVPQRYMNSFNYHLYHYKEHKDKLLQNGNWQPGDWLIHWPAVSLQGRIQLYNQYKEHIVR